MSLRALLTAGLCAILLTAVGPGPPTHDKGLNILLVGNDTRQGLSKAEQQRLHVGPEGCDCADVMMLVHLSARRDRVSVVSIPRDSYLPFAPHREPSRPDGAEVQHSGKVNAAIAHGGPALAMDTVERATGVRIHHYVELDFTGLIRAVDGFGGAPVCTERPLRDHYSGLDLPAGSHTLDGLQGLQYVRSRKVGSGVPGDMGRMRRQQHFVARLLTGLADSGALSDHQRLRQLARVVRDSAQVDKELTPLKLVSLGQSLSGVRPQDMEFSMVPIVDFDYRVPGWGSTLLWDRAGADALFARLREDQPITDPGDRRDRPVPVALDPSTIQVQVHNATQRTGTGGQADRDLRELGFATTGRPLAGLPAARRTVIKHAPGQERAAQTLAAALPGARLQQTGESAPMLHAVLGTDYQGVREIRYDRSEAEGGAVTGEELKCL
ncbi:LCP family protein [Streptomyces gobiensis]|uniref:LCP family protein n=1 Tax=Streptomyces gobiensis TaxID=2875706 RepID=UPI001E2DEA90|nr:LCP family protein [Streptomyces gobiensis]UGY91360.1 LCP family protein [Streptomyces gobiensis]